MKHSTSGLMFLLHSTKTDTELRHRRMILAILPDRYLDTYDVIKFAWPPADTDVMFTLFATQLG